MKKLTKKYLDELAKTMPVVKEIEMRTIVGGTYYYDMSGNFVTKVGDSSDVKFGRLGNFVSGDFSGTVNFSGLSGTAQVTFMQNMFGSNNVVIRPNAEYTAGIGEYGNLIIDPNSFAWNNMNDIRTTMDHEREHYENGHYLLTGNAMHEAEFNTYMKQINTSTYKNSTKKYKEETVRGLWAHIEALGWRNRYSEEQIMQMCGL